MEKLAKAVAEKYPYAVLALDGTGRWSFVCACETPEQAGDVAERVKAGVGCETRVEVQVAAA